MYIGKTTYDIETRFHQHLNTVNNENIQYPLYRAMRKYGIENFSVEEIEEINTETELNEREKYWIKFYDTYIKNGKGYNCTLGGEGNTLINKEEVYKLWDQGLSIKQIHDLLGINRSNIRKILKNYDNYTIEESQKRGDEIQALLKFKPVSQYDIYGNYINSYANMHQAEKHSGVSSKLIWGVVHMRQKLAGGYQWRFMDDLKNSVNDLSNEKIVIQNRPVKQIDIKTNEVINTYKSSAEASRCTGINSSTIRNVCHGMGKTAGGYLWSYY